MISLRRYGVLFFVLAAACGAPSDGEIVGDAYLAHAMGDEVDLAGLRVHLLDEPDRDTAHLDSTLADICVQRDRFLARLAEDTVGGGASAADSFRARVDDATARSWRARDRFLQPLVRRTVQTDEGAHFAFPDVEPGEYRIWSDSIVDGYHWSWLEPVRVESGDSLRVNLTTANADDNPFRCRPRD